MNRILRTLVLIICSNSVIAQTDYSELANWYFHPDKAVNVIANYNLDISVIDANLNIDSTISITNNSETNTGIDVFWVHPTQLTSPPTNFPYNQIRNEKNHSQIKRILKNKILVE